MPSGKGNRMNKTAGTESIKGAGLHPVQTPENSHDRKTPPHCSGGTLEDGKDFSKVTLGKSAAWAALVVAGIVLGQFILLGPSLIGRKTLLPLDLLAQNRYYLPKTPGAPDKIPHNFVLSDLVLNQEPARQLIAAEWRAGRWSLWTPHQYAGVPVTWPQYSPFWLLIYLSASPVAIAWAQVAASLVAGIGMYRFCRNVLQVGFWPAAVAASCYPMTGFFVFWTCYSLPFSVCWLPWMLLAVDATVRRASRFGGLGLAAATALTLLSGQLDVGGQVLLASGLYAVWCFIDQYGKQCFSPRVLSAVATVVAGWGLGFLLASPYLLPILEYSRAGSRMERRSRGEEERPPVGMEALPQIVLPDIYGTTQDGSLPIFPKNQGNQLESSAATYTGLVATLLLMPLAWCSRRHRSINIYWMAIGILGVSWCLDLPILVDLLRLPGLNMLSHNRFVFATSFAILSMAAVGLDVLWQGEVRWRFLFWAPVAMLVILLLWCGYSSVVLPDTLTSELTKLERAVHEGYRVPGFGDVDAGVARVRDTYVRYYSAATALCILALGGWAIVGLHAKRRSWFLPALAVVLVADLLWFAYDRPAQCDPALYYPRIPALEEVAKAEPGRIIGAGCLPALLGQSHNLRDVRGDDGVEPARLIDVVKIAADPRYASPSYAVTQWLMPKFAFSSAGGIRLHPVLDMLNVRYVIFRGDPPPRIQPDFSSPDYWVMTNRHALPRAYVPEQVETVTDDKERLAKLAAADFNPRQMAYVEEPLRLPARCRGSAKIVEEIPSKITVALDMQTRGLLVLSDRWDVGWHAYYDGNAIPILRANHALRGVVAPEGKGTIEFRYEPASLTWGLRLCGLALLVLTGWAGVIAWNSRGAVRTDRPSS